MPLRKPVIAGPAGMSISPTGRILPQAPAPRPQASSQPGFSVPVDTIDVVTPRPIATAPSGAVGVSLMLAMQECATAEVSDREARQHGKELLEALAELQRAFLSEGGAQPLNMLSKLSEIVPSTTDQALGQVLRAIQLRARVEIARAESSARRSVGGP